MENISSEKIDVVCLISNYSWSNPENLIVQQYSSSIKEIGIFPNMPLSAAIANIFSKDFELLTIQYEIAPTNAIYVFVKDRR